MATATENGLRTLLGGLPGIGSEKIEMLLASAERVVTDDGIETSDPAFADLQMYYAAHLLELSGSEIGAVASKSIADVSVTFSRGVASSWNDLYRAERIRRIGFSGRAV